MVVLMGGMLGFLAMKMIVGGGRKEIILSVLPASPLKVGKKYKTRAYRADAEHEWMKQEIENTKGTLLGKKDTRMNSDYNTQRPYAAYTLDEKGAEDMGFKHVSSEEAKARAEVSKKTTGEEVAKVDKARKSTIIED